ncbi:MAG: DciA family protein [Rhodospirillaceae bacterium]|jgi:hypothetical protein|nr:DciA family protein [Rhodospirillaceae bacterium]
MSKKTRGSSGPRAIAGTIANLTKKSIGQRGFIEASIIAEWSYIAPPMYRNDAIPLKITFKHGERSNGLLYIRVCSGSLSTQLEYEENLIVSRVNSYFGYKAVAHVKIIQGPITHRLKPLKISVVPNLTNQQEQLLTDILINVDSDKLRLSLKELGQYIVSQND